jgi:hypothetical protein
VQTVADGRGRARVTRGFSVPAGDYDICVLVRERIDPRDPGATPRAGVAVLPVSVPDVWTGRLSASTVLLARRLEVLEAAPSADDLSSRPYDIGRNELTPAADGRFGTGEDKVVVLLVYDATIAEGGRFDVEVEYHFLRRSAGGDAMAVTPPGAPRPEPGERSFNPTEPQRFTPASMGRTFVPTQPVLAGQGIPLAGFAPGEYRLAVQVADRLSGHRVSRDVVFTVVPRR